MTIAICDDEKEMRELLKNKIETACPEADIVLYPTGKELLASKEKSDLLFLDIQMPGLNGMEVARKLRETNQKIILIFVTALEEYVFEAFDVDAFHYLVKPFSDVKFHKVLQKAVRQYQELCQLPQKQPLNEEENFILVKTRGVSTRVLLKDIIYAEVYNRKIVLHTKQGEIEYYGKMSSLEEQLGEDFFRVHRAYLVHLKYVEKYGSTVVVLEQGSVLMAKPRYADFVKQYMRYIQRKRKS